MVVFNPIVTAKIEFGKARSEWVYSYPNDDQLKYYPRYKQVKMEAINYKRYKNCYGLTAIQLVFTNKQEMPIFEAKNSVS